MICSRCRSKWESVSKVDKCPFCGACLSNDAGDATVDSVLRSLINENGPEILKNQKLVKAYLMDCVKGQEKEKKMFDFACSAGITEIFCNISKLNDPQQRKIIVMKSIAALNENTFMSEEKAQQTVNIFLKAFGIAEESTVPYASSKSSLVIDSTKKESGVNSTESDLNWEDGLLVEDKRLVLVSTGVEKIKVIKAIRQITGLGLAEAKNLVDNVPSVILNKTTKDLAECSKYTLEQCGAKVKIVDIDSFDAKSANNSSALAISQTTSTPKKPVLSSGNKSSDFEDDQFYIMINEIIKGRENIDLTDQTNKKKKFEINWSESEDDLDQDIEQLKKKVKMERLKKKVEMERSMKKIEERKKNSLCQHCGGAFKGLFSKKCSICGKEKDY